MYHVAICDDEVVFIDKISELLQKYAKKKKLNFQLHTFSDPSSLQDEIVDGQLDTAHIRAFRVPAGVAVEIYATTLHYAPCHVSEAEGFRVAVVLPKGTNEATPTITPLNEEDKCLWARNKWLLAHPDSDEAHRGAMIRLSGPNISIN